MSNNLRVVLIPTADDYLLLPQTMLSHIYPYAPPMEVENASEYVIGGVLINNDKLPVLDFDFEQRQPAGTEFPAGDSNGYHFIIVKATTTLSPYRHHAILSHGEPLLREVHSSSLQKLPKEGHHYIAQYVALDSDDIHREIIILDLTALEKELQMS